jgi:hypothetical protein
MTRRLLGVLLAVGLVPLAGGASALAGTLADNQGCPQGFEPMMVGVGEADRRIPILIDAGGNDDGIVCARPEGDGIFHDYPGRPDTVYLWKDNAQPDCFLTNNPPPCDG